MIKIFVCAGAAVIMSMIVPTSEPYQIIVVYCLIMILGMMTWDEAIK